MHDTIANDDNKAYADAWKWDSLLEAMKGTESFTPPQRSSLEVAGIKFDASSHGTSGALHATYPA